MFCEVVIEILPTIETRIPQYIKTIKFYKIVIYKSTLRESLFAKAGPICLHHGYSGLYFQNVQVPIKQWEMFIPMWETTYKMELFKALIKKHL